eukprot:3233141-Lingulodinium_polyedra.AAC.1
MQLQRLANCTLAHSTRTPVLRRAHGARGVLERVLIGCPLRGAASGLLERSLGVACVGTA